MVTKPVPPPPSTGLPAWLPSGGDALQKALRYRTAWSEMGSLFDDLWRMGGDGGKRLIATHSDTARSRLAACADLWTKPRDHSLWQDWQAYLHDHQQRVILFLDALRLVGNQMVEQQKNQQEQSPVLMYRYEMVVDGRDLERPVNYALVRILPPPGTVIDPNSRPYIIIDPRAGHGPGIGGFKSDSQVGVALAHGHPVYFVIFLPRPMPGQTIADVTAAEAHFVREVTRCHPQSHLPVTVGNCQGGWAAMLLAATNPDITGPIVANGAPLSYWSGVRGQNPMRYTGGLVGGALPALVAADLGNGLFDGAHLVLNFELMNPGNSLWRKHYNLFANIDTEVERFVGFEKWWSGFYFLNEGEIRWITETLFVGNQLERGMAPLGGHNVIDLRRIKAPIIIFASHGDDITPPQQALGWIPALYCSEQEIQARGLRIIYMIHEDVGHLGIFVSAKVARKEHDQIVSTLGAVESLAPGLYEMRIEEKIGEGIKAQYAISFAQRTLDDLRRLQGPERDDRSFAAVARASSFLVDGYEMTARPWVQLFSNPLMAMMLRQSHPLRLRRSAFSNLNPLMAPVETLAGQVRHARKPVAPDNPFRLGESLWAGAVEQAFDFWRDLRHMTHEMMFFALWGNPVATALGARRDGAAVPAELTEDLRELPQVQAALMNVARGGYAEAVIRMLILMARSRGSVRQSRLERSNAVLRSTEPFSSMADSMRTGIINEQTLIIDFAEPEAAIESLPRLLPSRPERERAIALIEEIAGDVEEMSEGTVQMLALLRRTLDLPPAEDKTITPETPVSPAKPLPNRRMRG